MSRHEQVYTVGLPTGQGPAVIAKDINLPDFGDFEITAWIGNFGGSNVYLIAGKVSMGDAQNMLTDATDRLDVLCCLTGTGPVRVPLPDNFRSVTIFYEGANASGQTQAVTFVISECTIPVMVVNR